MRKCKAPDCNRQPLAKFYCTKHYGQILKWGRLTPEREHINGRPYNNDPCKIDGCEEKVLSKAMCGYHYRKQWAESRKG